MSQNKPQSTIYVVAGAPGAGKSTFVANAIKEGAFPAGALWHDCDAVMQSMPEYQADLSAFGAAVAFKNWELPARELAESQLQDAIATGRDIIYDRSCGLLASYIFLKDLVVNKNYKLIMYVLHVDLEIAHMRVIQRESTTARHLPKHLISERLQVLRQHWQHYLDLALEMHLLASNSAPYQTIAVAKQQQLQVLLPNIYKQFLTDAQI